MTQRTVKVGDVVAWADVPDGALVRLHRPDIGLLAFAMRRGTTGVNCAINGAWFDPCGGWAWNYVDGDRTPVTIIALGLTGEESADDLRRLAEVFEVREALFNMAAGDHATESALEQHIRAAAADQTFGDLKDAFYAVAERLHAAGFDPRKHTTKNAARLLTEAREADASPPR